MDGSKGMFQRLSPRARVGFGVGLCVIVLIVGSLAWWVFHPRYGLLLGHLHQQDAAEIVHTLDQWHVPYRITDGGASVLVPADQVYPTRMKLASSGVPHGGAVGFELFDHSDYGITEFAQRVNYLRALQGELERTIDSMSEVDTARVHLTLQRTGLFESSTRPAKGSVTVTLRPGRHLALSQVIGIQRLAASAVAGLKPEAVVVLDQNGNVLSAGGPGDTSQMVVLDRSAREKRIEARLTRQAEALLRDALRTQRFSVSVNVRLNYDRIKEVREELLAQGRDGNGLVVSEKHTRTPGSPASSGDAGAPGASTTEIRYAHGREQTETVKAPGRIERISVGVVVPASLSPGALEQLKAVVAAGLGLDARRGDTVDIATFAAVPTSRSVLEARPRVVPPPATPLHVSPVRGALQLGPEAVGVSRASLLALAAGVALLVLLLVGALQVRKRRQPPRLSLEEREIALARIRRWIDEPESMT